MISDMRDGTFGKVYTMDVDNGGVRLLDCRPTSRRTSRMRSTTPRKTIVSGKIKVDAIGDAGGDEDQAGGALPAK